jgi:hypothetical protein
MFLHPTQVARLFLPATRFSYCFHTSRVAINHMTLCIVALLTHYLTCLPFSLSATRSCTFFYKPLFVTDLHFSLAIGLNSITQYFHWMFNILTYCNHISRLSFHIYAYIIFWTSTYQYLLGHRVASLICRSDPLKGIAPIYWSNQVLKLSHDEVHRRCAVNALKEKKIGSWLMRAFNESEIRFI